MAAQPGAFMQVIDKMDFYGLWKVGKLLSQQDFRDAFHVQGRKDDDARPEKNGNKASKARRPRRHFFGGQSVELRGFMKNGGVDKSECQQNELRCEIGMASNMDWIIEKQRYAGQNRDAEEPVDPWQNML